MATKQQTLMDERSCLNRAAPEELIFVLRAKDPCAPATVRLWAALAAGKHEDDKVEEALAWAVAAEEQRDSL